MTTLRKVKSISISDQGLLEYIESLTAYLGKGSMSAIVCCMFEAIRNKTVSITVDPNFPDKLTILTNSTVNNMQNNTNSVPAINNENNQNNKSQWIEEKNLLKTHIKKLEAKNNQLESEIQRLKAYELERAKNEILSLSTNSNLLQSNNSTVSELPTSPDLLQQIMELTNANSQLYAIVMDTFNLIKTQESKIEQAETSIINEVRRNERIDNSSAIILKHVINTIALLKELDNYQFLVPQLEEAITSIIHSPTTINELPDIAEDPLQTLRSTFIKK